MKTHDWATALRGAEAWAVEQLAQGEIGGARLAILDRARCRDEMLTTAELMASLDRRTT